MACGCKGTKQPGTGFAAGAVQGRKLVYRIIDPETEECVLIDQDGKLNPDGHCAEFPSDVAAYRVWYANGQRGIVRTQWAPVVG